MTSALRGVQHLQATSEPQQTDSETGARPYTLEGSPHTLVAWLEGQKHSSVRFGRDAARSASHAKQGKTQLSQGSGEASTTHLAGRTATREGLGLVVQVHGEGPDVLQ